MMLLALLAAATGAPDTSAIDAERAFMADAQRIGQWVAFRKWAAPDAVMFVPQPVNARDWLKRRMNPRSSVFWWPGKSFVSCDGTVAVNSGPWVKGGGKSVGYFLTVWKRQPGGDWKWVYDGGDALPKMQAEGGDITSVQPDCTSKPGVFVDSDPPADSHHGAGSSGDRSLRWQWSVRPDGSRTFDAYQWKTGGWEEVVLERVGAEKP